MLPTVTYGFFLLIFSPYFVRPFILLIYLLRMFISLFVHSLFVVVVVVVVVVMFIYVFFIACDSWNKGYHNYFIVSCSLYQTDSC